MPVEEATYIHELNSAYPLGTGEPKSLGDDHLRLIKSAIQATFPNIAGAVTASHTQLSTLNEGTLPACNGSLLTNLNGSQVTTGTVADARLSSNVPLKNATNTFTAGQTIQGQLTISGNIIRDGDTDSGLVMSANSVAVWAGGERAVFSDGGVTLNGVNVTDYARLSQSNTFQSNMMIRQANESWLRIADTTAGTNLENFGLYSADGTFGIATLFDNSAFGATAIAITKDASQNVTQIQLAGGSIRLDGPTAAPTITQSTSTTLVAGQVHAIDGNATLPNMAAGQWVTVINNGSSARTVTKNGSDTMYWTATGSSVTSVTIPARGRASFVCADGTNVYASGNITGSS